MDPGVLPLTERLKTANQDSIRILLLAEREPALRGKNTGCERRILTFKSINYIVVQG
jgi:hypothetical protein